MSTETQAPIVVAPARYVMLPLANVITGYTVKAGTFSFLEEFPDYRYRDELSEVKIICLQTTRTTRYFCGRIKPAENSDLFEAVVNAGGVRHLADKASRAEIAPAAWRNFGSHLTGLTFSRNSTARGHLLFIDVSNIVAECPLRTRYHSAIDTRHYGRASDVLRNAILLQEGGIYMDTDVTCLKKLPVGISAPEGLLIGHGQSFYINALTNAVMAAPKRSETVSKLMGAIGGQFNRYDQKRW